MRSESTHPHVSFGHSGKKKNTSKPWKGKGKLAKKQKRLSERRLAHSATLHSLKGIPPTAFKTPGSMNQHK